MNETVIRIARYLRCDALNECCTESRNIISVFICSILLFSENVNMEFSGQDSALFKGTKLGKIYLTTHRMIYNAKNSSDGMQSFSFPFVCLTDVSGTFIPVYSRYLFYCLFYFIFNSIEFVSLTFRWNWNSRSSVQISSREKCVPRRTVNLLVKRNLSCCSKLAVQLILRRPC